ncbi:ATP-binding protein [Streptomyces sp. enrichment culture]|uniref:ATP-binding protein n=1 Tax=Streptomyces sp. enrichment culture TaxID=1795815 RepID=UPI003F5769E0
MIPSAPLGTEAAASPLGLGAAAGADPLGAAAERRFRFELAAHPGSPAQARRLTRARLNGWSVCEDTCDSAALVVSELVTNAIVHTASTHIVCELHDGDDLVRIAVRDEGCAPGQPHAASRTRPEEEHGRGLLLVDALCHAWGAHEHGPGLLVWAELPRTSDTAHDPAAAWNDADWDGILDDPEPGPEPGAPRTPEGDSPAADRSGSAGRPTAADQDTPRGDLGWGARPKRVPSDDQGDDEDTRRTPHQAPREAQRRAAHEARHRMHPAASAAEVPPQERRRERGPA